MCVLFALFRGKGSHAVFVLIVALIPILRFAFSDAYRKAVKTRFRACWDELTYFSQKQLPFVPFKSAFMLVGLPILILSLSNGVNISSMDNFPTSLVAASIVLEGNTEISEFPPTPEQTAEKMCTQQLPMPYYYRCIGQKLYSAYPAGMLLFAIPFTFVSKIIGTDIRSGYHQWRLAKWTSACVAAVSMTVFFLLACLVTQPLPAFLAALCLITGSTMLTIVGQGLWTQGGVMLGFLMALFCELRQKEKTNFPLLLITAVSIAWMLSCRLTAGALIIPFGLWVLSRSWQRGILLPLLSLILIAPLHFYYWKTYSNPMGPQMMMATGLSAQLGRLYWAPFIGILISPVCGLLVYQPWLLMGALSLNAKQRTNRFPKGFSLMLLSAIALHLFIFCHWQEWWSGVYGTRHLTEVIPLLALLLCPTLAYAWSQKNLKPVLISLMILSCTIQCIGLYARGGLWYNDPKIHKDGITEQSKLFDWTDPPFLYPFLHPR